MVTQKTIAELLGISQPTVGAVLGKHASTSKIGVSPELREKILATAKELGYRPNLFAQAMNGTRTGVIGVILYTSGMGNTSPQEVSLCHEIEKAGYRSMVVRAIRGNNAKEGGAYFQHAVDQMLDLRVDGVMVAYGTSYVPDSELQRMIRAGVPVVTVSGDLHEGIDHIAVDVEAGMDLMLSYLLSLGYRRILLGDNPPFNNPDHLQRFRYADVRRASFLRWMERQRIEVLHLGCIDQEQPEIPKRFSRRGKKAFAIVAGVQIPAIGPQEFDVGATLVREVVRHQLPVDAILLRNDFALQGALAGAQQLGLNIPHDYGMVGHDGVIWGQFGPSPFTTIHLPYHEIASKALELLLTRMETASQEPYEAGFYKMPGLLIAGATTRHIG